MSTLNISTQRRVSLWLKSWIWTSRLTSEYFYTYFPSTDPIIFFDPYIPKSKNNSIFRFLFNFTSNFEEKLMKLGQKEKNPWNHGNNPRELFGASYGVYFSENITFLPCEKNLMDKFGYISIYPQNQLILVFLMVSWHNWK